MARHDLRWFKCYPDEALNGSRGLTDAQFTTYWRLLFQMYAIGGPVPYDRRKLRFLLEVRPQDVARLIDQLVALGKLSIENGSIHNGRSDFEIKRMNEQWGRIRGSDEPSHEPHMSPQMELHIAGHNPEKGNDSTRAHDRAPARRAHPRQKIEDRIIEAAGAATNHTASEPAAASSTLTALPPREAAAVAHEAVGSSLPAQPAQPEPDPAEMQRRFAELTRSLAAKLTMEPDHEPEGADQPQPAGDRADQGQLPQPLAAAPSDPGNAQGDEDEGGNRGFEPAEEDQDESPLNRALRTRRPP